VLGLLEQALTGSWIVEPLDRLSKTILGKGKPEMPRGHLFDSVSFVKDHKIIREEIADSLILRVSKECEKECMVEHEDLCRLRTAPRGLVETSRITTAGLGCAEMLFATNLGPKLLCWLEGKVTE
jgi:hypothetical protein